MLHKQTACGLSISINSLSVTLFTLHWSSGTFSLYMINNKIFHSWFLSHLIRAISQPGTVFHFDQMTSDDRALVNSCESLHWFIWSLPLLPDCCMTHREDHVKTTLSYFTTLLCLKVQIHIDWNRCNLSFPNGLLHHSYAHHFMHDLKRIELLKALLEWSSMLVLCLWRILSSKSYWTIPRQSIDYNKLFMSNFYQSSIQIKLVIHHLAANNS